ncbi:hypothetical protein [Isoptericola sp. NPDC019482]|uniref:hypothetical protein n=1 Tax=Isoptericola sp. NPDC019482 TaxID=3154688 RepID=UPI00346C154E
MAAPTQTREGSTAARCVLTVLLLALAVLLGTTVPESAAPAAATAATAPTVAATSNETVTAGASMASIGDPAVAGTSTVAQDVLPTTTIATTGHLDEPAGLLCVCALLVTGLAMLLHGIAMLWRRRTPILGRESSSPTPGTGMRAAMQQASPLTWGVCRR